MNRKKVAVVIPVYKANLTQVEKISLCQVKRVLGRYVIFFAAPVELTVDYGELSQEIKVEFFPKEYFVSTESYSRLMLSVEFYQRFIEFEYIFLCQLDGFVFCDRLLDFCMLGYDYIGAPVPRSCWPGMPGRVGNGGMSLRRVSSVIRVLSENDPKAVLGEFEGRKYRWAEDVFFAVCGASKQADFSVPSTEVASKFALDQDVQHIFRSLSKDTLPFCCHAWDRASFPIWKPFIESQGYDLSTVIPRYERMSMRLRCIVDYLIMRLSLRNIKHSNVNGICESDKFIKSIIKQVMPHTAYVIWGYGKAGKEMLTLLQRLGAPVVGVYDKAASDEVLTNGIFLRKPKAKELWQKSYTIIVASPKYEKEIASRLESCGLVYGWDYLIHEELIMKLAYIYLQSFSSRRIISA